MYKFIFISLCSIFFFSCEKKISIPLPDEPTRPVLSSFMNQDSVIVARVTLSGRNDFFYGSERFTEPEGAILKLYENGTYIETLYSTIDTNYYDNRKIYKSHAKVVSGKTYRMTLEVPGYEMVEGSNIIPDRSNLVISNKSLFLTPSEYGYSNSNYRFTMTNVGLTKCYFRFRMFSGTTYYVDPNTLDTFYDSYKSAISIKTQSSNLSIFEDTYNDPLMGGIYSIQPLNPGESKTFTLMAENVSSYSSTYILEISNLTNDSYNYLYSLNNVLKNNDDPTSEKQNVICNVKNGFGIVGGMAIQEVEFK